MVEKEGWHLQEPASQIRPKKRGAGLAASPEFFGARCGLAGPEVAYSVTTNQSKLHSVKLPAKSRAREAAAMTIEYCGRPIIVQTKKNGLHLVDVTRCSHYE